MVAHVTVSKTDGTCNMVWGSIPPPSAKLKMGRLNSIISWDLSDVTPMSSIVGADDNDWLSLTHKEIQYLDENWVGDYEFLERIIRYDMYKIDTFDRVVSISKKENKRL